jgi:hypothetical protein
VPRIAQALITVRAVSALSTAPATDIEPHGEIVRLTVTEENFADEAERDEAAAGWAAVLSNLKSLLETGNPLPQEPWLVPQR